MKPSAAVLLASCLAAEDFTARGFDHFYNLEYDQAIIEFQEAIREKPDDAARYNHLAQTLLYREMLRAGALESEMVTGSNVLVRIGRLEPPPEVNKAFQESISNAMSRSQSGIDRNARDPMANYTQCVAYGLRANWNFLVRRAYLDALRDLTTSRKLCNRAVELDPSFIDAKLVQGFHDYVVGSLPGYVRMLGFLAGFHGDKDQGIATLKEVSERGKINSVDAKILLGVIYRRERKPKEAIVLLDDLIPRFPRNYLLWFELAQMWADSGDSRKALAAIDKMEELYKSGVKGNGGLLPEKIAFARGNIQFWYRDFDAAERNLRQAAQNAKTLDLHTGTAAWLRLGQTLDMKGRRPEAIQAYRQVIAMAPSSEMARESKRYLSSPYKREAS